MVYPGRKRVPITSHDMLRLHKCMKTLVQISGRCRDEESRKLLIEAAGKVSSVIEFVALINAYKHRIRGIS